MIFSAHPQSHSRLVGCYMLFYAVGSGLGARAGTHMYARAGWSGVCWLGAGVSLSALLFWRLTLRGCRPQRRRWSSESWKPSAPHSR